MASVSLIIAIQGRFHLLLRIAQVTDVKGDFREYFLGAAKTKKKEDGRQVGTPQITLVIIKNTLVNLKITLVKFLKPFETTNNLRKRAQKWATRKNRKNEIFL